MRKELLFFPVLALAITGCSNHDEVESISDSSSNSLFTGNSVSFTNNTTLTIGSEIESRMVFADFAHVLTASVVNDACKLDIEEEPTEFPADAIIVEDELVIQNDNEYDGASIYVKPSAKLAVKCDIAKVAFITVLKGGQMTFSGKGIDGVKLLCYGDLMMTSGDVVVAKDASVKVVNDLTVNGSLQLKDGELYVGGDLKCNILNVDHTASWHKNTALHVIGNLIQNDTANRYNDKIMFGNGAVACIEGSLVAYNVDIYTGSSVHVDCKFSVSLGLEIESATLNATYIDMSVKSSFAILHDNAKVYLPAGGVADFADIDIDGNGINLGIVGTGNAFLHCINFRMKSDKTVFDIHPDYYLSYASFYVGNKPNNTYRLVGPGKAVDAKDIEIETDLINVEGVKINVPEDDEVCNPGFTDPGTDPEPEPDSDKIVIEIPDGIEDDWFLKADDFAIRINGQYQEDIKIKDGVESLDGIKVTEENLTVTVSGIGNLNAGPDYTYEVWLWVSEETWMSFSDSQKAAWVSGDGNGTDITDLCKLTAPSGYVVRQNVYKGLSGHADTPYIKVSIHVTKEEDK